MKTEASFLGVQRDYCVIIIFIIIGNRNNTVGIATVYGLDKWGRSSSPGSLKNFLFSMSPRSDFDPPSLLSSGYRVHFALGKAAGPWNWPVTSKEYRGQENVGLYMYSPIGLHSVVLN
jgi:hypothetical protein